MILIMSWEVNVLGSVESRKKTKKLRGKIVRGVIKSRTSYDRLAKGKTTECVQWENLQNWTKLTETGRISVVRDVADRFEGWQQLTNYRDPENNSGALGRDILKKQRFVEKYAK